MQVNVELRARRAVAEARALSQEYRWPMLTALSAIALWCAIWVVILAYIRAIP